MDVGRRSGARGAKDFVAARLSAASSFPGYSRLDLSEIDLGRHGKAFAHHFEWNPSNRPVVTQLQVTFVECGAGYVFTATALKRTHSRFRRVLIGAMEVLRAARTDG